MSWGLREALSTPLDLPLPLVLSVQFKYLDILGSVSPQIEYR